MPYLALAQVFLQVLEKLITALNHSSMTPVMQQVHPTLMEAQALVQAGKAMLADTPSVEERLAAMEKAIADTRTAAGVLLPGEDRVC